MALRFTTQAVTATSDVWSPADETVLQLKTAIDGAAVDIEARVHADADWIVIETLTARYPIQRLTRLPFLRLTARGNKAGALLMVWDNE